MVDMIKKSLIFAKQHYKAIATGISVYGFINLIFYCHISGVPFPLSITALPTLFFLISAITFLICFAVTGLLIGPAFFQDVLFIDIYDEKGIKSKNNIKIFFRLSGWFLILMSILPFLEYFKWIEGNKWLIFFVSGQFIVAFFTIKYTQGKQWFERVFYAVTNVAFNSVSSLWIYTIVLLLSISKPLNKIHIVFMPIFFLLAIFSLYFLTFPKNKKFIIILIFIGFATTIAFSTDYTKKALNFCHVGGGYKFAYTIEKNSIDSIPSFIFKNIKTGETQDVFVLLNQGDTIYIKLNNSPERSDVYGIKKSCISFEKIIEERID